jgi:von Willebrand factor type A domain
MIRFDYPEVFLLAIPLAWAFRRWGWTRGATGWLRAGIAILLLLAMAVPRLNLSGPGSDVVVVVDLSRSMPGGSRQQMRDLIKDIESSRGAGDRVAVVAFGQQPVVERELSDTAYFSEFTQLVSADGSDLDEALLTALDRHSDPSRPMRILVMSDGEYNGASPLYAARRARDANVPIDFRSFEKPIAGDLAIESLTLPPDVAPNEPFQFSAMVYADQESTSTVIIRRDGQEIARRTAELRPGLNRLNFRDWVSDGGLHQYVAELDFLADATQRPLRDTIEENNRAAGVVRVVASPKLLLITHDGQPGNVGQALTNGKIPFDVVSPSQHPHGALGAVCRGSRARPNDDRWQAELWHRRLLPKPARSRIAGRNVLAGGSAP